MCRSPIVSTLILGVLSHEAGWDGTHRDMSRSTTGTVVAWVRVPIPHPPPTRSPSLVPGTVPLNDLSGAAEWGGRDTCAHELWILQDPGRPGPPRLICPLTGAAGTVNIAPSLFRIDEYS